VAVVGLVLAGLTALIAQFASRRRSET